jgi:hypothetical protein
VRLPFFGVKADNVDKLLLQSASRGLYVSRGPPILAHVLVAFPSLYRQHLLSGQDSRNPPDALT